MSSDLELQKELIVVKAELKRKQMIELLDRDRKKVANKKE